MATATIGGVSDGWTQVRLQEISQRFNTSEYDWNVLKKPLADLPLAAVLVPIVIKDGRLHIWLTKRSSKVGHDKGHVSFPGGMRDPSDGDAITTALREADEEIGLLPEHVVTILGRLAPRINLREYLVTPVLALVSDRFTPAPNDEVEFAFLSPLERFLSSVDHWTSHVGEGSPLVASYLHFFRYLDPSGREALTFGFTASLCITIACALIGRQPEYEYSTTNQINPLDPFRGAVEYLDYYTAGKAEVFFSMVRRQHSKI